MSGAAPRARVEISLGDRSYAILIGPGLLQDAAAVQALVPARDVLIVTNETIAPLYLEAATRALDSPLDRALDRALDRHVSSIVLPDGETHKTLDNVARIFDAMVAARLNRDAVVVALGGGVIGDMAGFAAACYQRGIDYVQIPTTLLAQVDSSVGGKTGINHPQGKNLIGAFHQPRCVIADTRTLDTLPPREYRAGLAEVVKYGLIRDAEFFAWLEARADALLAREDDAVLHAVRRSCQIKADVVGLDEREQGIRAILNLGHTFGHAVETATGYGEWLHGEAVAAGTVVAADLSVRLGWLSRADRDRAVRLFERFGLPVEPPRIGAARARELMGMDKKVLAGKLRLVLLRSLGTADVVADYDPRALEAVLHEHFA